MALYVKLELPKLNAAEIDFVKQCEAYDLHLNEWQKKKDQYKESWELHKDKVADIEEEIYSNNNKISVIESEIRESNKRKSSELDFRAYLPQAIRSQIPRNIRVTSASVPSSLPIVMGRPYCRRYFERRLSIRPWKTVMSLSSSLICARA